MVSAGTSLLTSSLFLARHQLRVVAELHSSFLNFMVQHRISEAAEKNIVSQGSCTSLEFKASHEKSLNFIKLKMSLNCFGK